MILSTRHQIKFGKHKPFPRPCKKCDKKFQPSSRHNKLCEECSLKIKRENGRKVQEANKLRQLNKDKSL